ncbi:hypothetical protein [Streptomyces sp. SCL15-6]|uniref:hypothetical protein n=1 Tax=Streptomyces sp. SCL15-6 TaxID=2967222 RepID=UPI00398FC093
MDGPATFSLFVRTLPPNGGFLVSAGAEPALDYLNDFMKSRPQTWTTSPPCCTVRPPPWPLCADDVHRRTTWTPPACPTCVSSPAAASTSAAWTP